MNSMGPKKRGQKLRAFRERAKVNMRELAEACGVHFTLVGKYETGEVPLTHETYLQLVDGIERVAKRAKAEQTAATLGVSLFGSLFGDLQSPPTKEFLQRLAENARYLAEAEQRENQAKAERLVQAELGTSATGEALIREFNEHLATKTLPELFEHAQKVTQERDELRAKVAELEQELARERANKVSG